MRVPSGILALQMSQRKRGCVVVKGTSWSPFGHSDAALAGFAPEIGLSISVISVANLSAWAQISIDPKQRFFGSCPADT